jgi:hypothetical protein
MNDNEKLVVLIRLRDMIYFGVRPTVRQCGFAPEVIQELVKERLVQLAGGKSGDDLDRFVIDAILPAGQAFILQQRTLRERLRP